MTDDTAATVLLDRASRDLPLDVEELVAGGIRRGRARQRRRRSVGVVAVACALIVAGSLGLAGVARSTPPVSAAHDRYRSVGPGDVAATLQGLLPGSVKTRNMEDVVSATAYREGMVAYRGADVTLMIEDEAWAVGDVGWPASDLPRSGCVTDAGTCVRRGADWVGHVDSVARDDDGRAWRYWHTIERHTPYGIDVKITVSGRPDGAGHIPTVLTDAQLTAIVADDVWQR